ncbi:MAG: DUF916 domain-containing protein [Candidatus Uhrbacteria bacterium]|nr:DUF916 domain-containing protein [Candidatus Uhrbacteria bacterium]
MNAAFQRSLRSTAFALALVFTCCFIASPVSAITVSPVLYDFEITPGRSVQDKIRLINDTNQRETFTLNAENFVASGEDGGQTYLDEATPTGLASWVRFGEPTITLNPGESAEFPFMIGVPEGAEPGGHYATLFFTRGGGEKNGSAVGIAEQVGVLLLVRVPGDVREDARVESLRMKDGGFLNRLPAVFELRIRNAGSVHLRPRGTVVVRNMLGSVVARLSANPNNAAVLPNSVRRIEAGWAKTLETSSGGFLAELRNEWRNFAIGRYTASVDVTYGSQQAQLGKTSVSFWVLPWHVILVAMVLLGGLIGLIRLYNAMLVRSAMKKLQRKRKG